jgi:hypothetical protein
VFDGQIHASNTQIEIGGLLTEELV